MLCIFLCRRALLSTVAATMVGAASSSLAVESNFNTGFDGWTQTTGISWQAAGGNPGGYLRFADLGPANGGQAFAPNTFHGDWLSTYGSGGYFSVDYKLFEAASFQPFPMWVRITGSGGVIGKNFPGDFSSPFDWTTLSLGLTAGNWALLSGTFVGCLSDVTEVLIFMSAGTSANEITGIDNVKVVPEPASAAAFGLGIAALFGRRRKRA